MSILLNPKISILTLILILGTLLTSLPISAADTYEVDLNDQRQILDRPYMDGIVLFDSNMNGSWDIYSMDGTGGNLKRLTAQGFEGFENRWPTISPDGQYFAFSSNRSGNFNIFIQEVFGNEWWEHTHNGSNEQMPDWSPWDQLLYVSDINGNDDIFMKNIWGTSEAEKRGNSPGVQMTFRPENETSPKWGGEGYANIFAYNVLSGGSSDIWAMNVDDLQNWPVREGSSNELVQDFHPYDSIRGSSPNMPGNGQNNRQPEFIFMKNSQLYFSTIGWQNDYFMQEIPPMRVPGSLNKVAFSIEDPCTMVFSVNEGGKIGLVNWCNNNNPILLPDGNSNLGADKVAYGRNQRNQGSGGMFGGNPMGGMRDMAGDMMNEMAQMNDMEEERMRLERERMESEMEFMAESDRERMKMEMDRMDEQNRMEEERMRAQMDFDRERSEMQIEADRERMRMEQEMRDDQMEQDREMMEEQRRMMNDMEGSGGRDDYFEPEERCFIEDEEDARGLFGNLDIGQEIDCSGMNEGIAKQFEDPTKLAMAGLVITVGATMLQMFRGN